MKDLVAESIQIPTIDADEALRRIWSLALNVQEVVIGDEPELAKNTKLCLVHDMVGEMNMALEQYFKGLEQR